MVHPQYLVEETNLIPNFQKQLFSSYGACYFASALRGVHVHVACYNSLH